MITHATTPPELSIVIPVLNGVPLLDRQLHALTQESVAVPFEVIVADNGSTDGTRALAISYSPSLDVRVIDAWPKGVSCARNCGVRAARSSRVVFLDHDDVIAPGYLNAMAEALAKNDLVASRMEIEACRRWSGARDVPQTSGLGEGWMPWAYGASLGVARDLYLAVGGCDEELVGGGDDVDLCWRAQMHGAELRFVPSAVVRYRIPDTARSLFRQGWSYGRGGRRLSDRYQPMGGPSSATVTEQLAVLVRLLAAACTRRVDPVKLPFLLGRRLGMLRASVHHIRIRPVRQDGTLESQADPAPRDLT